MRSAYQVMEEEFSRRGPVRKTAQYNSDDSDGDSDDEVSTKKFLTINTGSLSPSELKKMRAGRPTISYSQVAQQGAKAIVQRHLPSYLDALKEEMKRLLSHVLSKGVVIQAIAKMTDLKLVNDNDRYTVKFLPRVVKTTETRENDEEEEEEKVILYLCKHLIITFTLLPCQKEQQILENNMKASPPVSDISYKFVGLQEDTLSAFLTNMSLSKFDVISEPDVSSDLENVTLTYYVTRNEPYML